ncbi:winged helix-turn-helix domain-containing protein [Natronomonas sp. EA1]|uniref:winged helix-turn-helix domain-containing protein n=1 Tax=Natronomonas sp. EA1 TaxID=3421655 RepID=UPI003EBD1338
MDSSIEDVEAHILQSKYRRHVLEHLATDGPATPKEIATATNDRRPHVSRALGELRETGVVELQVAETRTVGRYYDLTEIGRSVWPHLRAELRNVEWVVAEPATPETETAVELATEEFGDCLRFVSHYDGETLRVVYADADAFAAYTDVEFEEAVRTLVFDHALDDLSVADQACWSEVTHFDDFSLLRVRVSDTSTIAISFDRGGDVLTPAFAQRIVDVFAEA